jgi:cell division protein FtsL
MRALIAIILVMSAHIVYMHVNAMTLKNEKEVAMSEVAVYERFLGSLDDKIENMVVGMN